MSWISSSPRRQWTRSSSRTDSPSSGWWNFWYSSQNATCSLSSDFKLSPYMFCYNNINISSSVFVEQRGSRVAHSIPSPRLPLLSNLLFLISSALPSPSIGLAPAVVRPGHQFSKILLVFARYSTHRPRRAVCRRQDRLCVLFSPFSPICALTFVDYPVLTARDPCSYKTPSPGLVKGRQFRGPTSRPFACSFLFSFLSLAA